jgi:hypothetical protein
MQVLAAHASDVHKLQTAPDSMLPVEHLVLDLSVRLWVEGCRFKVQVAGCGFRVKVQVAGFGFRVWGLG